MCPGKAFANRSVFIAITTMLWALNIEWEKDTNGDPIMPSSFEPVEEGIVVYVYDS